MKNKIFISFAVLLLMLGALGYGVYKLYIFQNVPVALVTSSPSPTQNNWKTYSDKEFNFEIKYPGDFPLSVQEESIRLEIPIKNYFRTVLANEAYVDIQNPAPECPVSRGDRPEYAGELKAQNATFTKKMWTGVGAGQLYVGADYEVSRNGLCYTVSLFTHSANGAGFYYSDPAQISSTDAMHAEDMDQFLKLVDNIVQTFRFQ